MDERTHFARVRLESDRTGVWTARSAGGQGSHQLSTMALANGLVVQPGGVAIEPGAEATVLLLP